MSGERGPTTNPRRPLWLFAIAGICVYSVILLIQPRDLTERMLVGRNDFVQLYSGAKLSGSVAIYSRSENQRIHKEAAGFRSDAMARHSRPPFYSVFLRPLAFLPYEVAYRIFQGISILSFLGFLRLFVPSCPELAAFASLSIPFFANLQNGQDATLALLFAGLSVYFFRRGWEFLAGLVLSLCAIKFHLFALVPLAVLFQRQWRVLYGGLAGGAVLTALSFVGGGLRWPLAYIEALRDGDLHPGTDQMPNLHTFSALPGGGPGVPVEFLIGLFVVAAVAYLASRLRDYETAFAVALIGSLLVSIHSYTQDCIVLLLPLAIVLARPLSKPVRFLIELASSPIPYFLLLAGAPFNVAMPILLLAILGAAVLAVRSTPARLPEGAPRQPEAITA